MKVMVTGGTGFVGSHTVSELLRCGHQVRLLVRSQSRIKPAMQPFGVSISDVVEGDVLDTKSIEKAATGCDATIHCASVYSLDPRASKTINVNNVQGTENVLTVAHKFRHDPIIHVSSFVALIGQKRAVLTQDSTPTSPPGAYFKSKAESDKVARQLQKNGAPVVITYPGSVWGPYDPHLGESFQIAKNVLLGKWRISVRGSLPISDVRDVAKLHASLMEKGLGPRRYFAPMQNISIKEAFSIISDITGRRLETISLPGWALMLPMKGLDNMQKLIPFRFPFNFQSVYCANLEHTGDDSATRNDLKLEPRPLAETMQDQIRWMASGKHISPTIAGNLVGKSHS